MSLSWELEQLAVRIERAVVGSRYAMPSVLVEADGRGWEERRWRDALRTVLPSVLSAYLGPVLEGLRASMAEDLGSELASVREDLARSEGYVRELEVERDRLLAVCEEWRPIVEEYRAARAAVRGEGGSGD